MTSGPTDAPRLSRPLGGGLRSVIGGDRPAGVTALPNAQSIPIDLIDPNPYQPRQDVGIDPQTDAGRELLLLADDIREHGVRQPLQVRRRGDRFQIVDGERRWRAALLAHLPHIPAVEAQVGDSQMKLQALLANVQRLDLTDLDVAQALRELHANMPITDPDDDAGVTPSDADPVAGLSVRKIARLVHKSHGWVVAKLALAERPELMDRVAAGSISVTAAQEMTRIDDADTYQAILDQADAGQRPTVAHIKAALAKSEPLGPRQIQPPTAQAPDPRDAPTNPSTAASNDAVRPGRIDDADVETWIAESDVQSPAPGSTAQLGRDQGTARIATALASDTATDAMDDPDDELIEAHDLATIRLYQERGDRATRAEWRRALGSDRLLVEGTSV